MAALADMGYILEEAGYKYSFDRMIYFNPITKKVFSVEFVEDHNESDLRGHIREDTGGGEWHFYFNSPPSEAVAGEIRKLLG